MINNNFSNTTSKAIQSQNSASNIITNNTFLTGLSGLYFYRCIDFVLSYNLFNHTSYLHYLLHQLSKNKRSYYLEVIYST